MRRRSRARFIWAAVGVVDVGSADMALASWDCCVAESGRSDKRFRGVRAWEDEERPSTGHPSFLRAALKLRARGMTSGEKRKTKPAGLPEEGSGRKKRGRPVLQVSNTKTIQKSRQDAGATRDDSVTRGLNLARRLVWRRRSRR